MAACWSGWWRVNGWLVAINLGAQQSARRLYKTPLPSLPDTPSVTETELPELIPLLRCPFCCPRSGDLSAQEAGRAGLRSCAPHQRLCTRGVEGRSSFWGAHPCATARCCRTTTSWWRNCTANICTASTVDRLHRTGSTSNVG